MMIVLSFLLSFGMSQLLGMLNALQLIIYLPLFESAMPANAGMFYNILTKLAVFDVFEIGDYVNEILGLAPTDPVNEKFETMGLEDVYFINCVGSFIFFIACYALLIMIWAIFSCFKRCNCRCINKSAKALSKRLFWNSIASLIFESFLNVVLCGLISFKYNFNLGLSGQGVQTQCALLVFAVYTFIPFILLAYLLCIFNEISKSKIKARFGKIYEQLKLDNGRKVLMNPFFYLLRRLWLAFLVVYGKRILIVQISQFFVMTGLVALANYQLDVYKLASVKRN